MSACGVRIPDDALTSKGLYSLTLTCLEVFERSDIFTFDAFLLFRVTVTSLWDKVS
jgi:hypothetical protein